MPDNHDTATVNRKGLLPKLSGSATDVLLGNGAFGASPTPDPLLLGNGSASAPTYSFSSDPNGMFLVAVNTLGFATNNVEAWRILSTGELRGPDAATTTSNGTARIIRGGPGGSVSGDGGDLEFTGGTPVSGNGGNIIISGAAGGGNGGSVSFFGGNGVAGAGGGLNFTGGNALSGNHDGGNLTCVGGNASGSSGSVFGGGVGFVGGSGSTHGGGGSVAFTSGIGGSIDGNSGEVSFQTGSVTDGDTGIIYFQTANATGTNRSSGEIRFLTGSKTGSGVIGNVDYYLGGTVYLRLNGTSKHLSHLGSAPSITAGGGTNPSIVGKDEAFIVTIGTGGVATSVEVTFANAFTNAPAANAQSDTDIVAFKVVTLTTKVTITATAPFTAGSKIHVICRGYE